MNAEMMAASKDLDRNFLTQNRRRLKAKTLLQKILLYSGVETTQYPLISMTAVFFSFEALQEFDITCFLSIAMVEERILVVPWVWVDGLLAPTNTLIIFP